MKKFVVTLMFILTMFLVVAFGQEAKVAQTESKRPEQTKVESPESIPLDKEAQLTLELVVNKLGEFDKEIRALVAEKEVQRLRLEKYLIEIGKDGYTIRKASDGRWEYAKKDLTKSSK